MASGILPEHPETVPRRANWQKAARRARVPLGLAFAVVFVLLARPTWGSMLTSVLFVAPGLGLRAWAAGTLRKKSALATTGPYAHTRNPLYVGSFLIGVGFVAAGAQWSLALALVLLCVFVYGPTIAAEERFLRGRFPEFEAYARAVPRLVPRFSPNRREQGRTSGFSIPQYVYNREYQALIGGAVAYAVLAAKVLTASR